MNDKSELIDELLVKVAHGKINSKEAKATLQKAFREVEIEGGIKEIERVIRGFHSVEHLMDERELRDRISELTKIKEDE